MIARLKEIILGKKSRGYTNFTDFREMIKDDVRDLKDISEIHRKLDELLEIKELYKDMLDWMVQMSEKRLGKDSGNLPNVPEGSVEPSAFSPRVTQLLEAVKEKGELSAPQASVATGLSSNRCTELLNLLHRTNHVEKVRVGHEVFYRLKQ